MFIYNYCWDSGGVGGDFGMFGMIGASCVITEWDVGDLGSGAGS